jgi:prepilin-type N-terminal cleavage/methylation domain-containing protein
MALMVKKAVKKTMRTFTAPTPIDNRKLNYSRTIPICNRLIGRCGGFTFIELVIVTAIVGMFVVLAQSRLFGLLRKNTFKSQVQEFISVMQMAATAASESDRRYEVIVDIANQSFVLRQITSPDLSEILEEEIMVESQFTDNCRVVYVQFDDGDYTHEGQAKFRAGRSGWAYGGKVVLLDENQQPYSIVVNRLNRIIELKENDVELLEPKRPDEVLF